LGKAACDKCRQKRKWKWENPDSTQHMCEVGWLNGKGEGESKGKPLAEKANVQCVCKKGVVMVIVCLPYSFSPPLTHSL